MKRNWHRLTATCRTFLKVGERRLWQECPEGSARRALDTRSLLEIAENSTFETWPDSVSVPRRQCLSLQIIVPRKGLNSRAQRISTSAFPNRVRERGETHA